MNKHYRDEMTEELGFNRDIIVWFNHYHRVFMRFSWVSFSEVPV